MDDLIADFIAETSESLQNLDNELVELENNPENSDLLSKIFRIMHTIKGTCGFLGLDKLAKLAHAAENILDKLRNKQIKVDKQVISLILEALDKIRNIITYIVSNGKEPDDNFVELLDKINLLLNQQEADKKEQSSEFKKEENKSEAKNVNEVVSDNKVSELVKVKVETLDSLMQQITELVLLRNQFLQLEKVIKSNQFLAPLKNLNYITSSLQELIMQTRMQPVGNAWVKIPRLVRDLSADLNKKIKLVMIGEETELDKQLIEAIKDPLVHMIRNSADHGLENEQDRIIAGKPIEGTITLKAYYSSGNVIIEISDDGNGINIEKIKAKILEKSLATEQEVAALSDQQLMQYIFRAGFSTSEKITDVSGRGVGMDIVKSNIDKIHGTVELDSVLGKGATFSIKIPLTLAIIQILTVEVNKQSFGIAQSNIQEMFFINEDTKNLIEEINDQKVLRLRETLIPLIFLSWILGLPSSDSSQTDYYIIICEAEGSVFGLIVDNIYDTEEIVLKPLSSIIKSIDIFSGITLLGNGEIILIIDAKAIAKKVLHGNNDLVKAVVRESEVEKESSAFLIVKYQNSFKAIPLELVARIEEIDVKTIENSGNKKVIQYDNKIVFLEKLDPKFKIPKIGKQVIVIINNSETVIGFMVEQIAQIFSYFVEPDDLSNNKQSIIFSNHVVDVVDVNKYFEELSLVGNEEKNEVNNKYKILLLESSPYFRKILGSLLRGEGFEVKVLKKYEDYQELSQSAEFGYDLFILDFNTSGVSIKDVTEQMVADEKFKKIPVIGITSSAELIEVDNQYVNSVLKKVIYKANHSELIQEIYSILKGKNG